jgi:hypothetical protein
LQVERTRVGDADAQTIGLGPQEVELGLGELDGNRCLRATLRAG